VPLVSQVERAVRNEDLFRQMNERLHVLEVLGSERDRLEQLQLLCECSATDCTLLIELTAHEYLAVREDGARFAVYPSDEHINTQIECVVGRHHRYWVVAKLGDAGDVAEELDQHGPPAL
jgi:hypothetical protein